MSRCERVTGRWRAPYLPLDRYNWSDEAGKVEKKREDVHLPGPDWRSVVLALSRR
jgi:hypothetical protein